MKKRLDILLCEKGLVDSRQKAQAVIMAGDVFVDGQKASKAGMAVAETAGIEVRGNTLRYVSRGGLKLEKAMGSFPITLEGKTAADIGASTGGFTDCMLQNPRVVCLERTNARYLTREQIPEPLEFASVDVSFISLGLILPALRPLLTGAGEVVCLVKPQFEAGRELVGKKGVVRDRLVHCQVLEQFLRHAVQADFTVRGLTFSPIRGPEGNIEYLGWLTVGPGEPFAGDLKELVDLSHRELEGET